MKSIIFKILPFLLISFVTSVEAQDTTKLIAKVIEADGGKDALHKLKDVSFDYTFEIKDNNVVYVSKERYIFDGEVSYAETRLPLWAIIKGMQEKSKNPFS